MKIISIDSSFSADHNGMLRSTLSRIFRGLCCESAALSAVPSVYAREYNRPTNDTEIYAIASDRKGITLIHIHPESHIIQCILVFLRNDLRNNQVT